MTERFQVWERIWTQNYNLLIPSKLYQPGLGDLSSRYTKILGEGFETPSFFDSSVALYPSSLTPQ